MFTTILMGFLVGAGLASVAGLVVKVVAVMVMQSEE